MALLVVLHLLALLILPLLWQPRRPVETRRDDCHQCRYAMTGLPEDAPCPECGDPHPRLHWEKPSVEWDGGRGGYILALLPLWIATNTALPSISDRLLALKIHHAEGFAYASALRWVQNTNNANSVDRTTLLLVIPWVLSLWATRGATSRTRTRAGAAILALAWAAATALILSR